MPRNVLKRTSRRERIHKEIDKLSVKKLQEYVASQKTLGTYAYDYATGRLKEKTGLSPDEAK